MTRTRSIVARWAVSLAAVALVMGGCGSGGERTARVTYNQALKKLEAGDAEGAAAGFLEARQNAGQDPELRYRAAFNLGLALSRQADSLAGQDPAQAMQKLRESAAWFRDAQGLRSSDEDARENLELVLRRIQILADQLNKGQNSLEARLDRVIEDQRVLRDRIRQLMTQVAESGSKAEPVAFQAEFDAQSTFERTLLADVGAISDLAGEELGLLQGKASQDESQLSDEERVRMVQLESLETHLQKARENLADTRRLLRRLQGDKAHRRADAGLHDLKRAREQLLDPVAVLKVAAEEQTMLLMHTGALAQLQAGTVRLGDDPNAPAAEVPPWLTTEHLAERQDGGTLRVAEILARFEAAASAPPDPANGDAGGAHADPKQARVLQSAREAIPFLQKATEAMKASREALAGSRLDEAIERQNEALLALFAAIERFSGIRDLIELVVRDHADVVALLAPPAADAAQSGAQGAQGAQGGLPEHLARLDAAGRAAHMAEAQARNLDRLGRLEGLFKDEVAALDAQAAQVAQAGRAGGQAGAQAPDAAAQAEELEQQKELYAQAEDLRRRTVDAVTRLSAAIAAAQGKPAKVAEARLIAAEATGHVEELRRLFYSIIEHLKELLRNQTDTHDKTGSAGAADATEIASKLGPLALAQQRHAATGEPLAGALAEQADAAAASQDPNAQQTSERMAQAATEVREAATQMTSAARTLAEDAAASAAASPDLSPTLDAQRKAMEHLENAIRLLEPPQQQQDQQDQQDQQQDQQDQQQDQQQQQQQQDISQQQAERRLQEIRDREAERMRDKQKQQRKPEPVEKDW